MDRRGAFSGATLTLQKQTTNGTWVALDTTATLTAAGRMGFMCGSGNIRVAVTGGPPSAIYSYAHFIG